MPPATGEPHGTQGLGRAQPAQRPPTPGPLLLWQRPLYTAPAACASPTELGADSAAPVAKGCGLRLTPGQRGVPREPAPGEQVGGLAPSSQHVP